MKHPESDKLHSNNVQFSISGILIGVMITIIIGIIFVIIYIKKQSEKNPTEVNKIFIKSKPKFDHSIPFK